MQGLHWAIDCLRSKGVDPKVLDIGTGTGLLAMMTAKCCAQNISSCEAREAGSYTTEWNGFQCLCVWIYRFSNQW